MMIILICGLPGTGKSYFAKLLSKEMNAVYLSSDMARNEMNLRNRYDDATKESVYDIILEKMREAASSGKNVIVDATFSQRKMREKFYSAAENATQRLEIIEMRASDETLRQRLSKPRADSQADFAVYLKLKERFDAVEREHLVLFSDRLAPGEMIAKTMEYIRTKE